MEEMEVLSKSGSKGAMHHDRVSECSMTRSNCGAVKSLSFFTLIVLLLVVLLMGRSDYPRAPQDTPGHPRILQDTPRYPGAHLISYLIHLFIHSDENKAKMASNSFHFQVHSFEKVLLNTAEKP